MYISLMSMGFTTADLHIMTLPHALGFIDAYNEQSAPGKKDTERWATQADINSMLK